MPDLPGPVRYSDVDRSACGDPPRDVGVGTTETRERRHGGFVRWDALSGGGGVSDGAAPLG